MPRKMSQRKMRPTTLFFFGWNLRTGAGRAGRAWTATTLVETFLFIFASCSHPGECKNRLASWVTPVYVPPPAISTRNAVGHLYRLLGLHSVSFRCLFVTAGVR